MQADLPNRLQVVVRVRPELNAEGGEAQSATTVLGDKSVQVALPRDRNLKAAVAEQANAKVFSFDACLGPCAQADVAEACKLRRLVEEAVKGYAVTIFAYGQTGSGKTHTIVGPRFYQPEEDDGLQAEVGQSDGLLSQAYALAFEAANNAPSESSAELSLSCFEIYNEQITDMLVPQPTGPLHVRHDKYRGFYVEDLEERGVASVEDALTLMQGALLRRHSRAHKMNLHSSRSHCVMTLNIKTEQMEDQEGGESAPSARFGKLVLVDLAGSERLSQTQQTQIDGIREAGSINKSLFALNNVLTALARPSGKNFVPYRDSTLTKLLYDSIKGDGRTLMVACCAPESNYADETLHTLSFASTALRLKCEPVIRRDPHDQLVIDLRQKIAALKDENKMLAAALNSATKRGDFGGDAGSISSRWSYAATPEKKSDTAQMYAPAGASGDNRRPQRTPSQLRQHNIQKLKTRRMQAAKESNRRIGLQAHVQGFPAAPPRPDPAASTMDFPELAALEQQFQSAMQARQAPAADDSQTTVSNPPPSEHEHPDNAASAAGSEATEPRQAEPRAVVWAEDNPWFGSDMEMTTVAYGIHDTLVEQEGYDPDSPSYYAEITRRVAQKFPTRMEQWRQQGRAQAAGKPVGTEPAARVASPDRARLTARKPLLRGGAGGYTLRREQILRELERAKEVAEAERSKLLRMSMKLQGDSRRSDVWQRA
ncbi:unnamed protein product [Pedinophyceae sp. YPF-701]|nr:unnamed protein product [Pedinophyceae sp. YPF-701]